MAKRWNSTITDNGLAMVAAVTDTQPLRIVRMACGSGSVSESTLKSQTALTDYVMDIPIVSSEQLSSLIYEVKGQIDNSDIETGFELRQIGVFAKLGSNETEILFMISQISTGCDEIPSAAESPGFLATYAMDVVFSSETNVEVVIDSGSMTEAKEYTDTKCAALAARISAIEGNSEYIFSDSVNFTLAAVDWQEVTGGYFEQTKYTADMGGVVVDDMRGTVGLGHVSTAADIALIAKAKIVARKNGANGLVFTAFGDRPTIDVPCALNAEYDGSSTNALLSVFPS